jgi:hypothetical protein
MRRFIIERSQTDLTSHAGLALVGQALNRHSTLPQTLDREVPLRHGIAHGDILRAYIGMLCLGKSDYEALENFREDPFFAQALGITTVASCATLRQRLDERAEAFLALVSEASTRFLCAAQANPSALATGHVPLDADVTPFDNSKTAKEGVSRTYKGHDGYAPMAAYLGREGYCLEFELREGSQHCQRGTPQFLRRVLARARRVTEEPVLLRLDGGNDALDNVEAVLAHNDTDEVGVDFLIKWNPRKEDPHSWLEQAQENAEFTEPRAGKRVWVFDLDTTRTRAGWQYTVRRVMRVIERTIDKRGQALLVPEVELEGWWTSLDLQCEEIIALYADHGTSEQFHSEFKTDLDIERLPSGKFATNALVLACSVLAYNILRWIGQRGLTGPGSPRRHRAKRRRIRTVMQELMYLAARFIETGRRVKLAFDRRCVAAGVFARLYNHLAYA